MKDNNEKEQESKEIQSLAGRIDKNAMGQFAQRSRPNKPLKVSFKPITSGNRQIKDGRILNIKFDETLVYRPRTQENKLKYESFLGRLNKIVQDLPQ